MSKLLKWIVAPAILVAGFVVFAPSEAKAQGFSIRVGGISYGGYGGYGYGNSCYAPQRSGVSFYYRAPVYSSFYAPQRAFYGGHGGGHYDYVPSHYDWHNGHYDFHPAHYDWHDRHHPSHGH
jgi:hypothetical protein